MAGTLAPWVKSQWLDDNGAPAAAHLLYTYTAGTSTKQATYSDSDLLVANTNPIVLDAAGRATVFLGPLTYKFVLAPADDTDPPTSPLWTVDNVQAVPVIDQQIDVTGVAGETVAVGEAVYLADGSGATTAGRWYLGDSNNTYSSTLAGACGFATTAGNAADSITVRTAGRVTGLSSLTAGSIYYFSSTPGALTLTAPANARPVAQADSTTSVIVWVTAPAASATVPGIVSTAAQTFAGVKTFAAAPVRTANAVAATFQVDLDNGYANSSTTTPALSVAVGTLATNGDQLIIEWDVSYSSATLSARITIGGTNTDFGAGGNTTHCIARVRITRISATSVAITGSAQQNATLTTTHGTQAVADLGANALAITAGMASGTYTIHGFRYILVPVV